MHLSQSDLFSRLDEEELTFLEAITQKRNYPKGSIIFYAGEEPRSLLVLMEGTVEVYKHDKDGNELPMGAFYPHSLIAEMALFESIPYPATARSLTDVTVFQIDFEAFMQHLLQNPKLILPIIHSLTQKIKKLEGVLRYTFIDDAPRRLARFFVDHEKTLGRMTQRSIAERLRLTPESVSRIVKTFKDKKWVEVRQKKLWIVDVESLREFAD